jgi:hypothetical protein
MALGDHVSRAPNDASWAIGNVVELDCGDMIAATASDSKPKT